jgi:voltage-dependent calcium channel R type alpha-1E
MNSISQSLFDYSDRDILTPYNQRLEIYDIVFTSIFIAEAGLKIIAMGFLLHRDAYLRTGWNIIDFIVVVEG